MAIRCPAPDRAIVTNGVSPGLVYRSSAASPTRNVSPDARRSPGVLATSGDHCPFPILLLALTRTAYSVLLTSPSIT